ncbi:iron-regulated membrane protein [Klebsiella pneumoniae]|uniref:Iron-regulated membrane protein n=1 Tax=Klebsiella pneumoniae TaxID=573 RepID=A0A3S5DH88_KLEPN|nr:iron-regulated membrane protein [Klebsiella pneumoniae]
MTHDPHAGHHMDAMAMAQHQPALQLAQFDQALAAARQAGLNASRLEIRPPVSDDRAWTVNEIDPSLADAGGRGGDRWRHDAGGGSHAFCRLSVDGEAHPLGRRFPYGDPLWSGESAAAGGFSCALCVTIGVGTVMVDPPSPQAAWDPAHSLLQAWLSLAWPARSLVLGLAFALGLAMPLMGASLLLFIAVDYLRWRAATAMRMMKSSD